MTTIRIDDDSRWRCDFISLHVTVIRSMTATIFNATKTARCPRSDAISTIDLTTTSKNWVNRHLSSVPGLDLLAPQAINFFNFKLRQLKCSPDKLPTKRDESYYRVSTRQPEINLPIELIQAIPTRRFPLTLKCCPFSQFADDRMWLKSWNAIGELLLYNKPSRCQCLGNQVMFYIVTHDADEVLIAEISDRTTSILLISPFASRQSGSCQWFTKFSNH